MTVPGEAPRKDVEHLVREIRREQNGAGRLVKIECWNHDEAKAIRQELEAAGVAPDAFFMSWLIFPSRERVREYVDMG